MYLVKNEFNSVSEWNLRGRKQGKLVVQESSEFLQVLHG